MDSTQINNSNTLEALDCVSRQQNLQPTCNQLATDTISRQTALDAFGLSEKTRKYGGDHSGYDTMMLYEIQDVLEGLPSAQPDIIRCRNCKFASGDSRICMQFGHSPIGELDFCAWAERRTDEE